LWRSSLVIVHALENVGHFLGVPGLLSKICELQLSSFLVLKARDLTPDIVLRHDSHDVIVIIQYRQTGKFILVS
jgi:hypothetical protein